MINCIMFAKFLLSKYLAVAIVLVLLGHQETNGERILFILPLSSRSMSNIFEPLTNSLAQRGHHLTLVVPVRFEIQEENVTQIIPISVEDYVRDYPDPFELRRNNKIFSLPVPFMEKNCHRVYQNQQFRSLVNQSFDLIIANIFFHDCFAGVMQLIGSPIILVGSLPVPSHLSEILGNHLPSSVVPFFANGDVSDDRMTFLQRTKNFLYNLYFQEMLEWQWRPPMEKLYRSYLGSEIKSITDIYKEQVSMIFVNSHYAITGSRPLLPNVIEIGGIHCKDVKKLPKELEEFVSDANDGFIVFSLGSIVKASSMPEPVRLAFLNTFASLKQKVIWKWELEDGMSDAPGNVKIAKWLPQQDLLGHPNMRLFITHGGLLSTEEAVFHGKPVIGMPIFVDQDANLRQAEILGFGIKGEILDLTQEKLEPLIRKVLDEPSYTERAKNLSNIFRDQPHTALEKAVFYTEYVMRHNGAYHLRLSGRDLNIFQYHCIDVIAFLIAISLSVICLLLIIGKLLWLTVLGRFTKFQKNKNE